MYTIGQFSRIGMVSSKTLRFYDEIGLLKPAEVDKWNAYRYYSGDQVADIFLINELRNYGFSLEEIKELIKSKDTKKLQEAMNRKLEEMAAEMQRISDVMSKLQGKIAKIQKGGSFMDINNYNVEVKEKRPQVIYGVKRRINMMDMCELINELCAKMESNSVKACGPMHAVYYEKEFNPEDTTVELCIPIVESTANGLGGVRILPGGTHACTLYNGPYSTIGSAYAAILKWINENDYKVINCSYEVYLVTSEDTQDENKYVTEICFPISK
ncbi:MAG: MerR family transcriptional regulator [Clostridia bacterium]|nr:MerR family transcriptional regulator [Clostridia bacterium]